MVKTRNFVEGDSTLATKAVWDDELMLIFCELCVNEVNAATGENARAPSSGVLPSGVPIGDDTPNEGFGDSDEHSNENEGILPNEVPSNPSQETPNQRKQTLGVVHGQMWVDEVLNGHDDRCMNSFRMPKNIFHNLLHDLQTTYGLKHGKVLAMEKLALSLYILENRESNSNATERFQRSGETVRRIFTDMLHIFLEWEETRLNPLKVNLRKY
ncbi:hypothetical protein CXB51_010715 [Gossypium anomalum]|uniref:DUF8040 domain-containing protein n=1 Tax=Gossypium anomalum TaxID=47600 RepID=A0A8J6D2E7_9ROSI|nr:hypothetical protein CXB51_010715 [Gossypium anomalum]